MEISFWSNDMKSEMHLQKNSRSASWQFSKYRQKVETNCSQVNVQNTDNTGINISETAKRWRQQREDKYSYPYSYVFNTYGQIEQLLSWNCWNHPRRCRYWQKTLSEARDLWSSWVLWTAGEGSGVLVGKKLWFERWDVKTGCSWGLIKKKSWKKTEANKHNIDNVDNI